MNTHCKKGHEWTPENTVWGKDYLYGTDKKKRRCLACRAKYRKDYYWKKKVEGM
jgi:hypothetical protein